MNKKKFKNGKIKRHSLRKKMGLKRGFGKPWSSVSIPFRVEFSWENPDGEEENFRTHWIECRKFAGEERSFLLGHYSQNKEEWSDRETLESKFVAVYCTGWLVENVKALGLRLEALGVISESPLNHMSDAKEQLPLDPRSYGLEPLLYNQCFIFPTTKINSETIRKPIYRIKWSENLAKNSIFDTNLAIVLNNAIWHPDAK